MTDRYNASLLLDENLLAGRGDRPAIVCGDERVTYAELFSLACRFGSLLRERRVAAGDRVLMVVDDCTSFPPVFLGSIRVGAVPVPVNPFQRAEEFRYLIEHSDAAAVVCDAARADEVAAAAAATAGRPQLLCVDGEPDGATHLWQAAAGLPDEIPPADTHGDDVAFWLYSSGSTGRPKAVVHLQHDIPYTCDTYGRNVLAIGATDTTFSTTKLFHAYGLGNSLSFPYRVGASTVLLSGRPTPEAVFETVGRCRPTLFFSVPTLYNAMLRAETAEAADFSSVRLCVSAAESLPAEIWERWKSVHGLTILDGIGSTEMLHIYCSNTAEDVVPGSTGRPVPGYEVRLVEEGREIAGPGVGDLHVRGGSALACYWNEPERTDASLRDGWFLTGDRYRRDEAGRYWYEGRADDMFKVSGLWVSPATVEAVLIEHPAVAEAAVVGAGVESFTRARAFVVPREGTAARPVLERELAGFCAARLHRYEVPHTFVFVDDLPKTPTGKIRRFALREA